MIPSDKRKTNKLDEIRKEGIYMKKRISILCVLALVASLSGCQTQSIQEKENETEVASTEKDYSNSTLTGKVTKVDGTLVTLQLGELAEAQLATPPEKPEGNKEGVEASSEMPEEDGNGAPPELPEGGETETPSELPEGGRDETPPEKPEGNGEEGEAPEGDTPTGNAPAGGMTNFTPGEETAVIDLAGAEVVKESQGTETEASLTDIAVDDILVIVVGDDNSAAKVTVKESGSMGGQPGGDMSGGAGGFGGSGEVTQGTAANTIDEDGTYSEESYTSSGDDENALRVDGSTVTLTGITVDKTAGASSNTEDGDFYGQNAALLATNGATVTIEAATVTSSAQNGNGVFSYGEGTVVNISDSTITTTADNSGGIQTTGGGTTNASNLTIETSGNSSAAIRSDRGGGTVNVEEGTYTSNGYNSPAIYSTAAICVKNALLTANNSEALVIEGKNSIALEDCEVSGNMSDTKGSSSDENVHSVMIYQSMSGDADVGTSEFSMKGGSLTSNNGDMFYITNTHCIMTLSDVEIINKETDGYLMLVSGNSASHGWGSAGSNGAQVEFTADAQILEGSIAVDTISTLDMKLTNGSSFTGTINIIENEEGGTAVENNAVVTVGEDCTWKLTGNCTITSLTNHGTIDYNGYTITLADGTVMSE